jgi:excisionase family DNA binding protein
MQVKCTKVMENEFRQLAREEAQKLFDEKFSALVASQQTENIPLKEFCRTHNVSEPTIYRAINRGHLSLVKFGGKSYLNRKQAYSLFARVK